LKIVATRCHILRRKCTKFDFGWGSAPDPAGGAYSAPPDLLAGIQGPTSKGEERGEEGGGEEGRGEGDEEGEGRVHAAPPKQTPAYATARGATENARTDIARPGNATPDQTVVLEHG